jgi:hypothetical protein
MATQIHPLDDPHVSVEYFVPVSPASSGLAGGS